MSTKVINLKVDAATKRQAQRLAERLGFSLSSVLKGYLRHFIKTRTLHFSDVLEEPSESLIKAIKEAEEDYKHGRTTHFDDPADALRYVDHLIAKDEQAVHRRN